MFKHMYFQYSDGSSCPTCFIAWVTLIEEELSWTAKKIHNTVHFCK